MDIRPGRISPVRNDARPEDLKPSSLVSSKPCHESSSYKELVDKYCFVSYPPGSFGGQPTNLPLQYGSSNNTPNEKPPNFANFTLSLKGEEPAKLFNAAAPSPPLSPRSLPRELVATEASRMESRPASGSPRASPRASPSMAFRYPYHQTTLQNGFMKDSQSSPVIRG